MCGVNTCKLKSYGRSNRLILTKQTPAPRVLQFNQEHSNVGHESPVNMLAYVNHALIGRVDEGLGSDTHRSIGSVLNIHESVYLNFRRWRGSLHFLLLLHGVCLQSCLLYALRTPVLCKCRVLRSPAKAQLCDQLAERQIDHKMKANFELRDCETETTIAFFFFFLFFRGALVMTSRKSNQFC